jgi:hypothetical protein
MYLEEQQVRANLQMMAVMHSNRHSSEATGR